MVRFYLDTEYTNGNYYQGDIFEIALVSAETCRIFHQYVKIPYNLPKNVKRLCNINDEVIQCKGVSFKYMINRLLQFVKSETNAPILVAHAGYLFDFPILFVNCIKLNINIEAAFASFAFIDTVRVLKEKGGYIKPGLKTITNVKFHHHSAIEDAKTLMHVFTKQSPYIELINNCDGELCQNSLIFSKNDILQFLEKKLPITIHELFQLVNSVQSGIDLLYILEEYAKRKSPLNKKQILKLSIYAYKSFH